MSKKVKIWASIILLISIVYTTICTSFFFFPNQEKYNKPDRVLLKTNWQQMCGFQSSTPDGLRTGCWSTALAQIAFYHKLSPVGKVAYTSTKGFKINETLDNTVFNLNNFASTIDSSTPSEVKKQMALYNYYAACAVQKDFGTDNYMNKLAPASLLEKHYKILAKRYLSWHNFGPYTFGKLEQIIYKEINASRPVFLHFSNLKNFGHSVVIDGFYYKENGVFFVHTNQGQGGKDDGWYDFKKGIIKEDDNALRVIYTIEPIK